MILAKLLIFGRLTVTLICIFLVTYKVEHLFIYLWTLHIFTIKWLFTSFCPFFHLALCLFLIDSFCMLKFYWSYVWQASSPTSCLLNFITEYFIEQKHLVLMYAVFSFMAFMASPFCVLSGNSSMMFPYALKAFILCKHDLYMVLSSNLIWEGYYDS